MSVPRLATIVLAVLASLLLPLGTAGTALASNKAVAATPAEITSFEWAGGTQQWSDRYRSRLTRTVFVLGTDGSFQMRQPDGFPTLVGTVADDGTFEASYVANSGVGYTRADATGSVGVRDGRPVMTITYTAGSAMGAVINDTPFGTNSTAGYRATLMLAPA